MQTHARISRIRRTRCSTPHYDQGIERRKIFRCPSRGCLSEAVEFTITAEALSTWPGATCGRVFTWIFQYRNVEFNILQ